MCYTYDSLNRVTKRTIKNLSNVVLSEESFTYDAAGNITDTFAYDTYGKQIARTGTSKVIFGYNGRDGVVTDDNGLIYMRARYYSPNMKRFINVDIIPGKLSNAVTLNRFAYANDNPVSFVDPLGLNAQRSIDLADYPKNIQVLVLSGEIKNWPPTTEEEWAFIDSKMKQSEHSIVSSWEKDSISECIKNPSPRNIKSNPVNVANLFKDFSYSIALVFGNTRDVKNVVKPFAYSSVIINAGVKLKKNGNIYTTQGNQTIWDELGLVKNSFNTTNADDFAEIAKYVDPKVSFVDELAKNIDTPSVLIDALLIGIDVTYNVSKYDTDEDKRIIGTYTVGKGIISSAGSALVGAGATAATTAIMAYMGSVVPGLGTAIGVGFGFVSGLIIDALFAYCVDDQIINIVENN